MPQSSVYRAMYAMTLYAIVQSLVWALVRMLSDDLSTSTLFFFRNLIGLVTAIPLLHQLGLSVFRTEHFPLHILRSAIAFLGGMAVFFAVAHAPLATVVAITYTAPIFASVFAMLVLKEGVTVTRIGVLVVGFVGTLMVLQPSFEMGAAGLVAAMISAVMTASAFLIVKQLSKTESSGTIVAYPFLLITPVSAVLAYYDWTAPSLSDVPLLVLMGLGNSAGQYFMARAFAGADASVVLPVDFLRLLSAAALGIFFFGDRLDEGVLLGASVILAATAYGARREQTAALAKSAK